MTDFQRASATIDELGEICEQLVNIPESATLENDRIELFERFGRGVHQISGVMARLRVRSTETDPNRQTYGMKMRAEVLKVVDKYDIIWEVYQDELKPRFDHLAMILQRKRQLEQGRQRELENARRVERLDYHQQQLLSRERERQNQIQIQELIEKKRKEQLQAAWRYTEEQLSKNRHDRLNKAKLLAEQVNTSGFRSVLLEGLLVLATDYPCIPEFQTALGPFCNLIYSISRNPDLVFLRVLRVRNLQFQESLGKKGGCAEILSAFGFHLQTYEDAAYQVMLADESWKERHVQPDKFPEHSAADLYWILPEPDSERDFTAWSCWIANLHNCEKLMASLQSATPRTTILQDWLRQRVFLEENS